MSSAEPKFPWERSWEGPHRPISPHRAEETRRAPRRVPMGLGFVGRLRLTMCPSPRANCQTPVAKIASRAPSHKIWARALPNSVGGALLPLLAGFWTVTTSMASSRSPPADFVLLPPSQSPNSQWSGGVGPRPFCRRDGVAVGPVPRAMGGMVVCSAVAPLLLGLRPSPEAFAGDIDEHSLVVACLHGGRGRPWRWGLTLPAPARIGASFTSWPPCSDQLQRRPFLSVCSSSSAGDGAEHASLRCSLVLPSRTDGSWRLPGDHRPRHIRSSW